MLVPSKLSGVVCHTSLHMARSLILLYSSCMPYPLSPLLHKSHFRTVQVVYVCVSPTILMVYILLQIVQIIQCAKIDLNCKGYSKLHLQI